MAEAIKPQKVKLFIGILSGDTSLTEKAEHILVKKYGPIDLKWDPITFTHTAYYKDISTGLYKTFFSFKKLIRHEAIVSTKLYTNKLEKKLSPSEKRKINIDPGYLTLSNVYLATCKEYFHRTYLTRGIYLENEYKYVAKEYHPWEWTYPDYQKSAYIDFFHNVREAYYKQIRKNKKATRKKGSF